MPAATARCGQRTPPRTSPGQQRRVASRRRDVDGQRLPGAEAVEARLATTVLTGLELLTLLGEAARAEPLLAALDGAAQARHFLAEMRVVRIECALLEGEPARARALPAEDPAPSEVDRVRARQAIACAAARLAEGDPSGARAALPADDAPGQNEEQRWRTLAVRIDAAATQGGLRPATRDAALSAPARDGVHAIAQWLLHRALACADASEAGACAARSAALAATLAGHPRLRAAFVVRWV